MKILFVNSKDRNCGVADYGRRLYSIIKDHFDIDYTEISDWPPAPIYDIALYNYHHATMPEVFRSTSLVTRRYALFHEAFINHHFDKIIPVVDLPRPLVPFKRQINDDGKYHSSKVIGSFGFGFPDKNFSGIANMVKREFSHAILRLNIPFAEFGDSDGTLARGEAAKCAEILKDSNIRLDVSHEFLEPDAMVRWLFENDLNVFMHIPSCGRGISSSIDYALSALRPIGISSSEMFRHLPREICVDNISLPQLIAKGIEPLKKVYEENSNERLIEALKQKIYG